MSVTPDYLCSSLAILFFVSSLPERINIRTEHVLLDQQAPSAYIHPAAPDINYSAHLSTLSLALILSPFLLLFIFFFPFLSLCVCPPTSLFPLTLICLPPLYIFSPEYLRRFYLHSEFTHCLKLLPMSAQMPASSGILPSWLQARLENYIGIRDRFQYAAYCKWVSCKITHSTRPTSPNHGCFYFPPSFFLF